MTQQDALYRAVCEHPDEDTPRLVFADWLEESGDPRRADFIRTQVKLTRVPESEREVMSSRGSRTANFWRSQSASDSAP